MRALCLQDADFGISGFVPKRSKINVITIENDWVTIDLGKNAYTNGRSSAVQRIPKLSFNKYFKVI